MIVTIDGMPVYRAEIWDETDGMYRISLVDAPAVQSDFMHFDSQRRPQMYAIADEERRLVRGVVMRADFPIYRRDAEMGEYYIIYKADTIRQMAEKYLRENRQNIVNVMHEEGSEITGVEMVQYFIKGDGVSVEGFDDIADGSLFAEFHVTNDEAWSAVKDGTFRGFSLEGYFELAPEDDAEGVQAIVDRLQGKFTKLKNSMKKIFKKTAEKFGSTTTDKGVIYWKGDEDIKVGDAVLVDGEDGEQVAAADGDYTREDGTVIRIAEGAVTEIVEPEEAPAEPEAEEPVEAEGGTSSGTVTPEQLAAAEERIAALEGALAEITERIARLETAPAGVEAHQQFRQFGESAVKTGNRSLDNLGRVMSARHK